VGKGTNFFDNSYQNVRLLKLFRIFVAANELFG
jgi:hypothetical protein